MKNSCLILHLVLFAFISPLFSQAGMLDTTFDADGKVITSFLTGDAKLFDLVIQPDQKILAAGYAEGSTGQDFALARYHPDGSLDASFGFGGQRTTDFGFGNDFGRSVVLQPDGKIIVAGYAANAGTTDFALARYLENGQLDSSFGTNGLRTTAINTGRSEGCSVALQSDGKIVVAGTSYAEPTRGLFTLTRYDPQGFLDASFGIGGIVTTAIDSFDNQALAVAIQPDGKIVVAGSTRSGNYYDFAVARYTAGGLLDPDFGTSGKQVTDFTGFDDYGQAIALQPDGKIVVAGYTTAGTSMRSFALVRYNADGTPDTNFDLDGKTTTNINGVADIAYAVTLQPDGKIVAAGYSHVSLFESNRFALVRYRANGTVDDEFGKVTTAIQVGSDVAYAVALQADGRIVVGGSSTSFDFALARYLSGSSVGVTDPSFSRHPVLMYPVPVREAATVEYTLEQAEPVSIRLYDYSGNTLALYADHTNQPAGRHTQSIVLPVHLLPGVYFVVLSTPSGQTSLKLVK